MNKIALKLMLYDLIKVLGLIIAAILGLFLIGFVVNEFGFKVLVIGYCSLLFITILIAWYERNVRRANK